MIRYISRRVAYYVVVLAIGSAAVFYALRLSPGDAAYGVLSPLVEERQRQLVREQLGLTKPIWQQYVIYLHNVFTGHPGQSLYTGQSIGTIVTTFGMNSVELIVAALAITFLIAIPLGVVSALNHNRLFDHLAVGASSVLVGIPNFVLALLLILVFAVKLGWLPIAGNGDITYLILPATVLAAEGIGITLRVMRASMIEQLEQDYVRTLRAKGLPRRLIVWRHALRNAIIPVISVSALRVGTIIGYTVVVEILFRWPGLSFELVNSVLQRDYPVAQTLSLVLLTSVIVVHFLADIAYAAADPRIRVGYARAA